MQTYGVEVRPASARLVAMLRAAFEAEGVTVEHVLGAPIEESRDATSAMALTVAVVNFVVTAADSAAVKRALDKVNATLGGKLKTTKVTPRHKK